MCSPPPPPAAAPRCPKAAGGAGELTAAVSSGRLSGFLSVDNLARHNGAFSKLTRFVSRVQLGESREKMSGMRRFLPKQTKQKDLEGVSAAGASR